MKAYSKIEAIKIMDTWGASQVPFFFIIDFEFDKILLSKAGELSEEASFKIGDNINQSIIQLANPPALEFNKTPPTYEIYQEAFDKVKSAIHYGNSYLLNLTFQSELETNWNLENFYNHSDAKYKVYLKDQFVAFSPEPFIKIKGSKISTFPMKGTIAATTHNAIDLLLSNKKEKAEHATIVDLLRNDLSMVANQVRVSDYRYIDYIKNQEKNLFQLSSAIEGKLKPQFQNNIGSILEALLPAGSITGAPKKKTVDLIKTIENYNRNFYTGVFGHFDGKDLDSAVTIRYIEKDGEKLYYKSGGGITHLSQAEEEYQELIDKIYVPIFRNDKNTTSRDLQSTLA